MVIEDYQDEIKPRREQRKDGKGKTFLLFFAAWIVIAVISFALFFKPIKLTLEATNAIYVLKNLTRLKKELNTRTETLCFINLAREKTTPVYVKTKVQKGTSTEYHDVLEGLLEGPDVAALAEGNVTLIAKGTRLEGFALSENVCFVCLSKEFLESQDINTARLQIENTIRVLNPELQEVVIMVDGNEISDTAGRQEL